MLFSPYVRRYSDLGNTTKFLRTDNIDNAAKTLWPKIEESSSYDFTWIPNSGTGITSGAQARVIGFYSNNNYESQMVLTYLTSAPISQREKINGSWGKWKVFVTKSDLQSDWIPLKPYLVNSWEDNGASLYRKIGNCYLIKLSVRYGNYETDLDICRNLPFSGAGVCTNCFYNSSEVGNAIQVSGNRLFIVRTPIAKMDTIFANFIVGPNV